MVILQTLWTLLISVSFLGLSEATCTHPSVRKEWRKLSIQEKTNWVNAVKCLAKLPHDNALTPYVKPADSPPVNQSGSYYDDLVYMHIDMQPLIRFTGFFLPWHRWYLAKFESVLKSKCGFTGATPYWAWNLDAPDLYGSSLWDANPVYGLGTWGNKSDDIHVEDGAFGERSSFRLSYPSPHPLRRNFTLQPFLKGSPFWPNPALYANTTFTTAEVHKMGEAVTGDFEGFQRYIEFWQGVHSSVHQIIGGDHGGLCPAGAPASCKPGPGPTPNDPIFWLHHGMIDKVWFDWQHKNPTNAKAFAGGSVQRIANVSDYNLFPNGAPPALTLHSTMPTEGMFPQATIGDILSTTDGILCYVYE